jgi:2'-5' RNA ligase
MKIPNDCGTFDALLAVGAAAPVASRARGLQDARPGSEKMPYSINIRSDDVSASKIRDFWALCARLEETPSMDSLGYPPHFTLAVFDYARESTLIAAVESLAASLSRVAVRFDRISHFETPTSIILWAAPADTPPLVKIHRSVHDSVTSENCRAKYRPGIWVPHCSLAVAIDPSRRREAMAIIQTEIAPFEVIFDVVDCAHFHPVEIVHEKDLQIAA